MIRCFIYINNNPKPKVKWIRNKTQSFVYKNNLFELTNPNGIYQTRFFKISFFFLNTNSIVKSRLKVKRGQYEPHS